MPWKKPTPQSDPPLPDDVLEILERAEKACGGVYTRISAEARSILGEKIGLLGRPAKLLPTGSPPVGKEGE
jgi:hypothetical protein